MTMLEPQFRFSDVAFGMDATPKTLRNWLQRDLVDLFSPDERGWRKFPLIDVCLLALIRHLVAFGINVETASALAHTALVSMPGEKWLAMNREGYLMFWVNRQLIIYPEGEPGSPGDASGWKLEFRWANDSRTPPASAFLTLAPGRIVREAMERAISGDVAEPDSSQ